MSERTRYRLNCPSCRHRNRDGSLYCTRCGTRLGTPPAKRLKISIVSEPGTGQSQRRRVQKVEIVNERRGGFNTTECPLSIGRDEDNRIMISDEQASARHARITTDGQDFWIEDLGSTNGTHVDGIRIDNPARLHPNSLIKLGTTIMKIELLPEGSA